MIVVDVGNTFTRVAVFDGEKIRTRQSFYTADLDVGELDAGFAMLADEAAASVAWIASVQPHTDIIVETAAARAGFFPRFIRSAADAVMPHRLSTPDTTGVDRLLAAMAAGARHVAGGDAARGYVTIQCGSAATVDYVDGHGVFRGGYILPGPGLWLSGLSRAAQLPDFSGEPPDWGALAIGDNTRDAILHGMALALPPAVAAAAERLVVGSPDRPAGDPPIVVTGGWGEIAASHLRGRHVYDRDLLLHGIRLFAERHGL